jgi:hypothetical protein
MHSRKPFWIVACLLIGMTLCAENLWGTGSRSLIPCSLNSVLVAKEMRHEKHQGVDDVYLLTLESGAVLEVDQTIFDAVLPSQRLAKNVWERTLHVDDSTMTLTFSPDFEGMLRVMPVAIGIFVMMGVVAWRSRGTKNGN